MTCGQRIRELRREKQLTQETLAKALNIHREAISLWESDKSKPAPKSLSDLAKYFETDVSYILGISDFREPGAGKIAATLEVLIEEVAILKASNEKTTISKALTSIKKKIDILKTAPKSHL